MPRQRKIVTVQGQPLVISRAGDDTFVNRSRVEQADIKAKNGFIHVIDTVLLQPVPKAGKAS